ncbi:MAG: mannonate dehydratase, partial [Rhodothermales bacterium]
MTNSRRDFIRKSASAAALVAVGTQPSSAGTSRVYDTEAEWMKLSIAYFYGGVNGRPQRVALAKQMGVLGGVGGGGRDVAATKQAYEDNGLEWTVLEGVNLTRAQLGVEGRDENIERFVELMQSCSDAGIDTICYNWMPAVSWSRSDTARVDRGGSLVTAFDMDDADPTPTEFGDDFTHEELWDNMAYFLQAVVPEAERLGIKLALHPDDPPVERLRGIPRIITSVDALKRVTRIVDSPSNGLCFCQGSIASQGPEVDIPAAIRWFGERGKIHFVHFRDVRGTPRKFTEAWHDDGQNDMFAAMQAYYDVGFRGPIRPDHVPTITGYEENEYPGYNDLGTLFAIGYIRGLMEGAA